MSSICYSHLCSLHCLVSTHQIGLTLTLCLAHCAHWVPGVLFVYMKCSHIGPSLQSLISSLHSWQAQGADWCEHWALALAGSAHLIFSNCRQFRHSTTLMFQMPSSTLTITLLFSGINGVQKPHLGKMKNRNTSSVFIMLKVLALKTSLVGWRMCLIWSG